MNVKNSYYLPTGLPPHNTPPSPPTGPTHHSTERICRYVDCKLLHQYCKRHLVGSGTECGLQEVCCNLPNPHDQDRFQGAFSSPFNSLSHPGTADSCGLRASTGVNGRIRHPIQEKGDADFGEYPWQAAVLKKEGVDNVYVCAGTLIHHAHVLTAAHCVSGYEARNLRVRLGEWDVNRDTEFYPHIETDVTALYVHPEYYSGNLINDLAVVRLREPVDALRSPHITPICLPSRPDYTGHRCWVSGWGKDDFGSSGQYQTILKEVDMEIVDRGVCEAALRSTRLGPTYSLHPGMICAGGQAGKDACKGDGGGPLACESSTGSGVWELTGIVSWGIGCGAPGVPGVYVNIAYYSNWIREITTRF
ncbi:hypothetical protein Pcinc_040349 [Petrolisthes cinctipes]|uniref:Peptidase S1 domain-containing protein n=1 Tax=Petrolisthes cinctipes TaxID=88211 RepID=A0AAE1BQG5_PETCI|nr:hypothetical protein Pcinc_040349 [Petrolisthes cinctipes]